MPAIRQAVNMNDAGSGTAVDALKENVPSVTTLWLPTESRSLNTYSENTEKLPFVLNPARPSRSSVLTLSKPNNSVFREM